jgi:hypothetical protein
MGLGEPTILRFLSGVLSSDIALVHSAVAQGWIEAAARRYGLDVSPRLRVLPPPRDPRLVLRPGAGSDTKASIALYNHRLYEHYGTSQFVDLVIGLSRWLPELEVQVTDMFGARRESRSRLDSTPEYYLNTLRSLPNVTIVSDGRDRGAYRKLILDSSFGIAPFRQGCTWSMSVIDCHAMGVPVIGPRLGWFCEAIDSSLQYESVGEAVTVASRLLLDQEFRTEKAKAVFKSTEHLSPERVVSELLAVMAG